MISRSDAPTCSHCAVPARLTDGREIHPSRPEFADKRIWVCDCGARVGCHRGTTAALGTPARSELRHARVQVHAVLDPIWQGAWLHPVYRTPRIGKRAGDAKHDITKAARNRVYAYLATRMGLTEDECHVGLFGPVQCRKALRVLDGLTFSTVRDWAKARQGERRGVAA